jgi:adenine-specific DNA-methyltransferase
MSPIQEIIQQTPYLTEQIIPYIGNKRKLLPLIHRGIMQVLPDGCRGRRFLDPFAGSGIVSRFAKFLGFQVFSNDWERYAYLLSYAYVKINRRDLNTMFAAWGGVEEMLTHLNTLPPPAEPHRYIARYYCPKDDRSADYRVERMFYTSSNGLTIDAVRNEIERLYPPEEMLWESGEQSFSERVLLLALLIQQAATHTNTSGVFKAYHKGFGGHSGDALSRILRPIRLPMPVLWDSDREHTVSMLDAGKLVEDRMPAQGGVDIAYIDPPYNQHQYGSNYHLLNTIALWDRVVPEARERGNKAGIRRDWVQTRSAYCYRDVAPAAFAGLLDRLDARHIFISYSTEGIIPFDELVDLCADRGRIGILTNEYVKYRGGRQSIHRLNHNLEFLLIIDTASSTMPSDRGSIEGVLLERRLNLQIRLRYVRSRLEERFVVDEGEERIGFPVPGSPVSGGLLWIRTRAFFSIEEQDLSALVDELGLEGTLIRDVKQRIFENLEYCSCRDRSEELHEVLRILDVDREDRQYFASSIPHLLRKMAHRKYRRLFEDALHRVRALQSRHPHLYECISQAVDGVEELARKRFTG